MTKEELQEIELAIFEELKQIMVENKDKKGNEAKFYIPVIIGGEEALGTFSECARQRLRVYKQPEDVEKNILKSIERKLKNYFFGC